LGHRNSWRQPSEEVLELDKERVDRRKVRKLVAKHVLPLTGQLARGHQPPYRVQGGNCQALVGALLLEDAQDSTRVEANVGMAVNAHHVVKVAG
jgi:hypothetical protein